MFFCRKCLIAAAAAPKVLTPILVPAATLTEEEDSDALLADIAASEILQKQE